MTIKSYCNVMTSYVTAASIDAPSPCSHRLDDTQEELDETKRKSARTLLATEDEMVQMKAE